MKKITNKTLALFSVFSILALGCAATRAEDAVKLEKPGLITTIGQSSDIAVVKALLNSRLKLGLEVKPAAQASDLTGVKTLVVVLGASTKGLGSAGINLDQENARATALMKAAKEQHVQVLGLHVGGETRRGKTTDDLIELTLCDMKQMVVVASGNKDKFFNTIGDKCKVPVAEVETLAAAGDKVKALFAE
jgi:hypothetical protein